MASALSADGIRDGDDPALLRAAAGRAAALCGGSALVFSCKGGQAQLRSAAAVAAPDVARAAAAALAPSVQQVALDTTARQVAPVAALGARGAAGCWLLPIGGASPLHGVLAVATPSPLSEGLRQGLAAVAEATAAGIERAALLAECQILRARLLEIDRVAEEKGDEVLRLSEALFAQDIELLRNNERLGQVEKLKSDFIEKMSRELRTPLNSIIEAIIAVLAGENDVLSDTAQQCLRRALDDGTAFLRTLQNILDLWRIKQAEMPLEIQEVNFREVVEEAIFSVQDTLGNSPVRIEKHFEEPLPNVRTDLAKINQILFLLLDNAAKFTAEGTISISAAVADGELVCELRDTGIGICPDDQARIFEEFYQVDDSGSTKYRGSGLGLALVRDLIGLLGGSVAVSSEVGEGSSFRFRVPVDPVG
jgi:signal transduction histidine kinase